MPITSESSFFSTPVPAATIPNTTIVTGPGGANAPTGGLVGQVLKKLSSSFYDNVWSYLQIPDVVRVQSVSPGTGGVLAIDYSQGEYVQVNLNQSVTSFSIINWPASGKHGKLTLEIINGGAFSFSTWGGVKWSGGIAPTLTSGAGKVDHIVLWTTNGGAAIYGSVVGQNSF